MQPTSPIPSATRMSAAPRPAPKTRSSRRGGSAVPRVILGGGVGALGQHGNAGPGAASGPGNRIGVGVPSMSSSSARAAQHRPAGIKVVIPEVAQSPAIASASSGSSSNRPSPVPSLVSPRSSHFDPASRSPVSRTNDITTSGPSTVSGPSAAGASSISNASRVGQSSSTGSVSSRRSTRPPTQLPTQTHAQGQVSSQAGSSSQASLSTTASTSSRTLKTPHYKSDRSAPPAPRIAGTGESPLTLTAADSPVSSTTMLVARPSAAPPVSPTPTRMGEGKGKGKVQMQYIGERDGVVAGQEVPPLPVVSEGSTLNSAAAGQVAAASTSAPLPPLPLPPVPVSSLRIKTKPAPLRTDSNRLSQGWVEVPAMPDNLKGAERPRLSPTKAQSQIHSRNEHGQTRLPAPQLVPMKPSSPSPKRPSFDRAQTDPLHVHAHGQGQGSQGHAYSHGQAQGSPTPKSRGRNEYNGRQSLDQLRATPSHGDTTLSPLQPPGRSSSKSTPPSVVMASAFAGAGVSGNGEERGGLFRAKSRDLKKERKDGGQPRKSSDVLKRPSMDIFARKDKEGKKDKGKEKAERGEQSTPPASFASSPSTPYATPKDERKATTLSLKKSSGALRALFKNKGKEKDVPAVPTLKKDAYLASAGAVGESMGRRSVSTDERPRPPFARSVTPSAQSMGSPASFDSPTLSDSNGQSRSSLSAEKSFFPTPPPMLRAVSDGPQFLLNHAQGQGQAQSAPQPPLKIAPATPPKPRKATPRLPAAPVGGSHATPDWYAANDQRPALPSSGTETSLAYMRQSIMYDYGEEPSFGSPDTQMQAGAGGSAGPSGSSGRSPPSAQPLGLFGADLNKDTGSRLEAPIHTAGTAGTSASGTSTSASGSGSKGSSSASRSTFDFNLPSVKSLHLLSLPDFDFSMDVSFDRFTSTSHATANGSPSTPRKSPGRSMSLSRSPYSPRSCRDGGDVYRGSPTPSPSRAYTLRAPKSPEHLQSRGNTQADGVKVERRRSQSFDGSGHTGTMISDLWRTQGEGGYVSPHVARLFGNPQSSSAPLLSKQLLGGGGIGEGEEEERQGAKPQIPTHAPLGLSGPIDFSLPLPSASFGSADFAAFSHAEQDDADTAANMNGHAHSQAPEMSYAGSKDTCSGSSSNGLLQTASERSFSPSPSPPSTPPEVKSHFGLAAAIEMDEKAAQGEGKTQVQGQPAVMWNQAGPAPAIPLPLLPVAEITEKKAQATAASVKEAEPKLVAEAVEKREQEPKKEELLVPALVRPPAPTSRPRTLVARSRAVSISQTPPYDVLSHELDNLLRLYRFPPAHLAASDRANLVRVDLVGLLAELDRRAYDPAQEGLGMYGVLRRGCFDWAETLLEELRTEQPAHERGACLEGLAAVIESSCLSEVALQGAKSSEHGKRFTGLMTRCMAFVMGKLGAKGVFHNTLLFSGRFLAFAFFRIPHIAEQLVTVLQPQRGALMRFTRSMLVNQVSIPDEAKPVYPKHLAPLCFDDSRSYTARLAKLSPTFATTEEQAAFLFQAGNWLRRWQSDDSELFPAFYRAYHRQLAIYLGPAIKHYEALDQPLPVAVLLRAPGYAHLATIFATKCHSYILGSVNAVTTSSSVNNFEAQETAGFRGSQKPAVLETANRRLVETLSTFANLRITVPASASAGRGELYEVDGTQLYGGMIDAWTRNLISKTSLYAPKAVFSLFDLLDGIVDTPYPLEGDSPSDVTLAQRQSLLDVPHLIWTLRIILTQGEHALTLVKAIAFIFTHWEALTARPEDRRMLCLELLLKRELFERLLLFWSQSVRSYILRLVVFRLGHLHTIQTDGEGHAIEIESVKLLQTRLDHIKSRHDELEPKAESDIDSAPSSFDDARPVTPVQGQSGTLTRSRSTITMVQDSPSRTGSANKAERLLGLGFGMENKDDETRIKSKSSLSASSAAGWFKKLGKKGRKSDGGSSGGSRSPSPSPNMGLSPSPNFASPAKLDNSPLVPPEMTQPGPSRSPQQHAQSLHVPQLRMAPTYSQRTPIDSPLLSSSPTMTSESGSESPVDDAPKKTPPPLILTSSPTSPFASNSNNGNGVAFEFELPLASPRSDSFDPAPSVPPSPRKGQPASPGPAGPASPHMSKRFSKRSSLLPPKTASVIEGLVAGEGKEGNRSSMSPSAHGAAVQEKEVEKKEPGYEKKLHAYAIRMLAELEDAQKEYDEWWSETGVGRMDGAPPRLAVAWPFHEGED